jgi:hypothetical protein
LALPFGVITQATYATEETSVQGEQAHASDSANLLSYIPKWVDATPTILPEQSDQPIVPPTSETEDRTWIDRKQKIFGIGQTELLSKLMIGLEM